MRLIGPVGGRGGGVGSRSQRCLVIPRHYHLSQRGSCQPVVKLANLPMSLGRPCSETPHCASGVGVKFVRQANGADGARRLRASNGQRTDQPGNPAAKSERAAISMIAPGEGIGKVGHVHARMIKPARHR